MARVQLILADPANRLTLKTILEAEGHVVVDQDPDVVITEDPETAAESARQRPTLVLASAGGVRDAVAAMRNGVHGYLFVPFQPGEAGLMVERAARAGTPGGPADAAVPASDSDWTPMTLEEVETRHILATLRRCRHNQSQAARILGIGRNTLWRKRKKIREAKTDDSDER